MMISRHVQQVGEQYDFLLIFLIPYRHSPQRACRRLAGAGTRVSVAGTSRAGQHADLIAQHVVRCILFGQGVGSMHVEIDRLFSAAAPDWSRCPARR